MRFENSLSEKSVCKSWKKMSKIKVFADIYYRLSVEDDEYYPQLVKRVQVY